MFDFNKPKIEITELSEDKKFGRFVVEPLERGYGTWKFFKKNYAVFPAGCSSKPG